MTRKEYLERNKLMRNTIGGLVVIILLWSMVKFIWQIPIEFFYGGMFVSFVLGVIYFVREVKKIDHYIETITDEQKVFPKDVSYVDLEKPYKDKIETKLTPEAFYEELAYSIKQGKQIVIWFDKLKGVYKIKMGDTITTNKSFDDLTLEFLSSNGWSIIDKNTDSTTPEAVLNFGENWDFANVAKESQTNLLGNMT